MKSLLISCAVLLAASATPDAQTVKLRISGTVFSASVNSGPFAGVIAGDPAVWEADLNVPGTDIAPGQYTNYSMVAGSYTINVGGAVDSPSSVTVGIQNDFPVSDGMQIFMHGLGSGGFQELTMSASSGTLFGSTDLTMETGVYSAALLDGGAWDMFTGGGSISINYTQFEVIGACTTTAIAVFRNDVGNTNPLNYFANAPVLGGTWMAQVTNSPGPLVVAGVVGYKLPLDVPLPFGSLLVDVSLGEILQQPPLFGPVANFSVPVPGDTSLCGFTFSTQGYGFGGGTIALYNAYDLTVGL